MLKFRRISVSVLQVITFKRIISSTLVNAAECEPHNHVLEKVNYFNVCKVHVLLGI